MNIEQMQELKIQMEEALRLTIEKLVDQFQTETGLMVTDVGVNMIREDVFGEKPKSRVTVVRLYVVL